MTSQCPGCDSQISGRGGFYRCGPCLSLWELCNKCQTGRVFRWDQRSPGMKKHQWMGCIDCEDVIWRSDEKHQGEKLYLFKCCCGLKQVVSTRVGFFCSKCNMPWHWDTAKRHHPHFGNNPNPEGTIVAWEEEELGPRKSGKSISLFEDSEDIKLVSLCAICQRLRKGRDCCGRKLDWLFGENKFHTVIPGCITVWDEQEI